MLHYPPPITLSRHFLYDTSTVELSYPPPTSSTETEEVRTLQ